MNNMRLLTYRGLHYIHRHVFKSYRLCLQRRYLHFCTSNIEEFHDDPKISSYEDLYKLSIHNPEAFWGPIAKNRLEWIQGFDNVLNFDRENHKISWFENGKLNVTVNCIDRHYRKNPNKTAIIWEKDEPGQHVCYTYSDLYKTVNRIGNMLRDHGVKKGQVVIIYMTNSFTAIATMMACARIGAVHAVVFAGFSAIALASRINDASAEIVITSDQGMRGGKVIPLKGIVDDAVAKCNTVKKVFVAERTGAKVDMGKIDINLTTELQKYSDECDPEVMDSEDPLFLLYTSGSTGSPKGLVHTQAGYLLYAAFTNKHVFNFDPEKDVFGCLTDIGWITGHTQATYGPTCNGGTSVIFESTPVYPDPGRYWEMVHRIGLTHIFTAPTALRLLLKHGDDHVHKYDRSSLKILSCAGEPINLEAWNWFHDIVGNKNLPVIDNWWQTETGSVAMSPRPAQAGSKIVPAMPQSPTLGIDVALVGEDDNVLQENDVRGALCIKNVWPGIARTILNDHNRYIETYFSQYKGFYFSGDNVYRNSDGHYRIIGRMDDVINVTGHRLGTGEIEAVLCQHDAVAETAVIGYPHELKGEAIYAYVTLKSIHSYDAQKLTNDLKSLIRHKIAGYAVPDYILFTEDLPKTRSGKIMRRILTKIASNEFADLGDTSTLTDPNVVQDIISGHQQLVKNT